MGWLKLRDAVETLVELERGFLLLRLIKLSALTPLRYMLRWNVGSSEMALIILSGRLLLALHVGRERGFILQGRACRGAVYPSGRWSLSIKAGWYLFPPGHLNILSFLLNPSGVGLSGRCNGGFVTVRTKRYKKLVPSN